ncbi:MAG: DUF4418 family protein [Eubacteriales bacterium]|nr:DUF4418 family protein [Eubacteriales bacterium]
MKNKIISVLLLIAGIAMTAIPLNTDCAAHGHFMKNGQPMGCHYSAIGLTILGGVVIVAALLAIFIKNRGVSIVMYLLAAVAAVLGYLIPRGIIKIGNGVPMKEGGWMCGVCKSPDMACHQSMMPIMNIVLGVVLALSIIGLIMRFLGRREG